MVNWASPEVIAEDGVIFLKLMHALLGLYCWEWFVSLGFDWQYITGKKKFRWPMIFYFLNRYILLVCLIGIAVALNVTTKINCQILYTVNQVLGNMVIGLVSINLSIRTIAVWGKNWYIVVLLVIVILGHWSLLMHGVLLKAQWNPQGGCIITQTNPKIISATFIYSTCFDFLVLCLTGYKFHTTTARQSRLGTLIFTDGLVYFIVVFLANVIAVTFLLLNLNPVMSIIGTVPAAIASTIVTCRAIRRVANYASIGAEMYQGNTSLTAATFSSASASASASATASATYGARRSKSSAGRTITFPKQGSVHIQVGEFDAPIIPLVY